MAGWIKLHRQIQNHWIWEDSEKLKWWLDLILMANHQDNKVLINGELVVIEMGERHTSEEKLAARWGVSRNTVRKFLNLLVKDDMISIKKSRQNGTTYKVRNYNVYQGFSEEKKQQTEQRTEQQKDNGVNNELNINKNDKEGKNEKNVKNKEIYSSVVAHLNEAAGTSFKESSKATQRLIDARLKEKFTEEDFKQVIDKKVAEWKGNPKMEQYLRPNTLFGTKFESYLNQNNNKQPKGGSPLGWPEF